MPRAPRPTPPLSDVMRKVSDDVRKMEGENDALKRENQALKAQNLAKPKAAESQSFTVVAAGTVAPAAVHLCALDVPTQERHVADGQL